MLSQVGLLKLSESSMLPPHACRSTNCSDSDQQATAPINPPLLAQQHPPLLRQDDSHRHLIDGRGPDQRLELGGCHFRRTRISSTATGNQYIAPSVLKAARPHGQHPLLHLWRAERTVPSLWLVVAWLPESWHRPWWLWNESILQPDLSKHFHGAPDIVIWHRAWQRSCQLRRRWQRWLARHGDAEEMTVGGGRLGGQHLHESSNGRTSRHHVEADCASLRPMQLTFYLAAGWNVQCNQCKNFTLCTTTFTSTHTPSHVHLNSKVTTREESGGSSPLPS